MNTLTACGWLIPIVVFQYVFTSNLSFGLSLLKKGKRQLPKTLLFVCRFHRIIYQCELEDTVVGYYNVLCELMLFILCVANDVFLITIG